MPLTVKGRFFKSFQDPPVAKREKKRYVFLPGTQSVKQRKRAMYQRVRKILDSRDAKTIAAGDRALRSVSDEPDPEYALLHLYCAALDASGATGEAWPTCMHYLMDQFDEEHAVLEKWNAHIEEEKAGGGVLLRGLLRALIPRSLRKGDEKSSAPDVD
jgi:hypothetical protein